MGRRGEGLAEAGVEVEAVIPVPEVDRNRGMEIRDERLHAFRRIQIPAPVAVVLAKFEFSSCPVNPEVEHIGVAAAGKGGVVADKRDGKAQHT